MIMQPERFFSYILIQCRDQERDESLNVGLVLFDAEQQTVAYRVTESFDRVQRTLPGVPVTHVRALLQNAADSVQRTVPALGVDGLTRAQEEWRGVIRASGLRTVLASNAERAADDLYNQYVAIPKPAPTEKQATEARPVEQVTARFVANGIRRRLVRNGLKEQRDFFSNVKTVGLTRGDMRVPVRYPIRLYQRLYIEAVDVKPDEEQSLNIARAVAQKTEETLRANPDVQITVAVRDARFGHVGEMVAGIINGDGKLDGHGPTVARFSVFDELDEFVKATMSIQPDLAGQVSSQ